MAKRKSWALRIEAAEKRGRFIRRDVLNASEWHTCAIGERHDWEEDYWRRGWEEEEIGFQFTKAVQHNDIAEAKRLYLAIQALP